jgi:TPR repeat protein
MRVAAIRILPFLFFIVLVAAGQEGVQASSLQQRANAGDAKAQFELGRAYEDGKGVPQDDGKAVEWFRKAAEQGDAQAQNSLGVMYALGRGVPRDREEAVRWYKMAARQGLTEAMYNVAISYYNGEGAEQNISLACSWMMMAQRKGDAQAAEALKHIEEEMNQRTDRCKMDLALLYEKGVEVPQDLPASVALYMETARQDDRQSIFVHSAQYKMCQLYIAGTGVPQDYTQAKFWCKKSANPFSYIVLARMAEKGLGQEKNPREAQELYRDAAMLGVPDGYMESGRLEVESGTRDGLKRAYFWYAIGARKNYKGAAEKLREVAAQLSGNEVTEEQKRVNDWFKLPSPKQMAELKKH